MKKLLFVGDSPQISTGFGRTVRENLRYLQTRYEVAALSWNAGCPVCKHLDIIHPEIKYKIYFKHKLPLGGICDPNTIFQETVDAIKEFQPDYIVFYGDIWDYQYPINYQGRTVHYLELIKLMFPKVIIFGYLTVDARFNQPMINLKHYDYVFAVTEFGARELERYVDYKSDYALHGVDIDKFYPLSPEVIYNGRVENNLKNDFVIVSVSRNQFRKNLPALIKIFSKFAKGKKTKLVLLTNLEEKKATNDINLMVNRYGCQDKIIMQNIHPSKGLTDEALNMMYNLGDIFMTASHAEAFSIPLIEAMACRVPCIAPDYAGHGEITRKSGGIVVKIDGYICQEHDVNDNIGVDREFAVPSEDDFVAKLNYLYENRDKLEPLKQKAYAWAREHSWRDSAEKIHRIIERISDGRTIQKV